MKCAFLLFAAVIGLTAAGPLSSQGLRQSLVSSVGSRNSALEELILSVLEDLRALMLTGSDTVPVLDPFYVDSLDLDDQIIPVPGAQIALKDLTVTEMSTFEINSLSVTRLSLLLQRYKVEIDGSIPFLDVTADAYDLFLTVLGFNVFGSGDAKIKIVEPRILADITVAPRFTIGGIYLNMLECNVKLYLKSFEPTITGMFNDAASSEFVSAFMRNLIPELLEYFEPEITEILSTTAKDIANDILSDLNLISILE